MTFDWPCDERVAHGPHVVVEAEGGSLEDWSGQTVVALLDVEERECPGVLAHPNTMIGRVVARSVSGNQPNEEPRSFDSLIAEADRSNGRE